MKYPSDVRQHGARDCTGQGFVELEKSQSQVGNGLEAVIVSS